MLLEMLLVLIVIGAVALVVKKVTLAQVMAEVAKLEGEAKAEELAIVAKVKSLISNL